MFDRVCVEVGKPGELFGADIFGCSRMDRLGEQTYKRVATVFWITLMVHNGSN